MDLERRAVLTGVASLIATMTTSAAASGTPITGFRSVDVEAGGVRFVGVIEGSGAPVLLLHGFPETHIAWRKVVPSLTKANTIIAVDLPGYGDSRILTNGGPRWGKRRVAAALVSLMASLGHQRFFVVGHDRGARVGYRMALDHPDAVAAFSSLTVIPTLNVWPTVDRTFAQKNFHWFMLGQPSPLPESLLAADPDAFINAALRGQSGEKEFLELDAIEQYRRAFRRPSVRHAVCEDYRAALDEDSAADEADRTSGRRLSCPVQILWSTDEVGSSATSPIDVWRSWADDVTGKGIDGGHLLAEERPDQVLAELSAFLGAANVRASLSGIIAASTAGASAPAAATRAKHTPASRVDFVTWLEGAAATSEGDFYFSDVRGNRQYKLAHGDAHPTVFRERANYPNGAIVDDHGRLITCEAGDASRGGIPRLTRIDLESGARETLVETIEDKLLLGPNDVRIDTKGFVWFTDGARPPFLPPFGSSRMQLNRTGVYRIDRDGRAIAMFGPAQVSQPNGLGFSPDGRFLFVNDNDPSAGGPRLLLRFALDPSGRIGTRTILHDFGSGRGGDGMIIDSDGNVAICAGLSRSVVDAITADVPAGVHFFDVEGRFKGYVPVPEDNCTNLVEHPLEKGRFLVTAGRSLYDVRKSDAGSG